MWRILDIFNMQQSNESIWSYWSFSRELNHVIGTDVDSVLWWGSPESMRISAELLTSFFFGLFRVTRILSTIDATSQSWRRKHTPSPMTANSGLGAVVLGSQAVHFLRFLESMTQSWCRPYAILAWPHVTINPRESEYSRMLFYRSNDSKKVRWILASCCEERLWSQEFITTNVMFCNQMFEYNKDILNTRTKAFSFLSLRIINRWTKSIYGTPSQLS